MKDHNRYYSYFSSKGEKMEAQVKKEFQRRISQANKTELVIIVYEMIITYIDDALEAYNKLDRKHFVFSLNMARKCIWDLRGNLDFEYGLSKNLFSIYNFADREFAKDIFGCKNDNLDEIKMMIKKLHDAYEKISIQDKSKALMQNPEEIYAGITYGKGYLNETTDYRGGNRGFLV